MPNVGEAWYEIEARTNKLRGALDASDRRIDQTVDRAHRGITGRLTSAVGGFGRVLGSVAVTAVSVGTIALGALGILGGLAVKNAADMESMAVAWETMLGSEEAALQRMQELREFAAKTPFEIPEVMAASRQLQVFGGTALATGDNLRLVGDIAAGVQQPFTDVAMWIGRTYDAMRSGQPFGEAAMRLQEMGALSGEGRRKLEELAKAAKDGSITMDQAWSGAQDVFGQFSGMMSAQSATLNGQISNLMDNIGQMLVGIGEILMPLAKTIVEGFNAALPTIKEVLIDVFEKAGPVLLKVGEWISGVFDAITKGVGGAQSMLPGLLAIGQSVFNGIAEAIGWVIENVLPDLIDLLGALVGWFQTNGPTIATIAAGIADVIGDVYTAIEPIARTILPMLGDALGTVAKIVADNWPVVEVVLKGVLAVMAGMFAFAMVTKIAAMGSALLAVIPQAIALGAAITAAFGPIGLAILAISAIVAAFALAWSQNWFGIQEVVGTVVTAIVAVVDGVIGFFTDTFMPAIEGIGEAFSMVWSAVGSFFGELWNGLLRLVGGIVGTMIGIIKNVVGVAAEIPGPWQEGAKKQKAALESMEQAAKGWGQSTTATMTTSYEAHRRLATRYGSATARAYAEAYVAEGNYFASKVDSFLASGRRDLVALSPPRYGPLKDIGLWAGRTAEAYADAWTAKGPYLARAIEGALTPTREFLQQPNIGIGAIGATRTVEAHLTVEVLDPNGGLASVPGGAEGVARELQRGIDATGLLRALRHETAVS